MITTVAIFTRLRLFQELLSSFVGARPEFAVIAIAASEMEATRVVVAQRPDVILIDAGLPGVWNVADAAVQAGVRTIVFGLAELHKLGTRRRTDAARLLHVAASTAVVEARTVRHLGIVGREPRDERVRVPAG